MDSATIFWQHHLIKILGTQSNEVLAHSHFGDYISLLYSGD